MVALSAVQGQTSGVLYHLRLWVMAIRMTVVGRVAQKVESEHVIMVVGYGSMTVLHSNALMMAAYVTVTFIHMRHVRRHG